MTVLQACMFCELCDACSNPCYGFEHPSLQLTNAVTCEMRCRAGDLVLRSHWIRVLPRQRSHGSVSCALWLQGVLERFSRYLVPRRNQHLEHSHHPGMAVQATGMGDSLQQHCSRMRSCSGPCVPEQHSQCREVVCDALAVLHGPRACRGTCDRELVVVSFIMSG